MKDNYHFVSGAGQHAGAVQLHGCSTKEQAHRQEGRPKVRRPNYFMATLIFLNLKTSRNLSYLKDTVKLWNDTCCCTYIYNTTFR